MNTHRTLCLVLKANSLEQPAVTHAYVTEHQPERAAEVRKLLEMHGGCSAGCKIANIDPPNSAARVWTFYRAFLDCVQEFGRLSELALMGSYNMSSGRLFTNMAKAPWFFLKGKITLSPHKIRQIERLERVFPRVEEGEELRGIRPPRGQGEDGHVPAGPRLEGLRPGRQADRAGRRHPERGPGRGNLLAVVAHINEGLCQGCGACAVTCRSKSIEVQGFRDDQLYDEINAICG